MLLFHVFNYRMSIQIFLCCKFFNHIQKQPPEMLYKTAILKNFVIFTGKRLCWGLFFIKVVGLQGTNCIKKGLQHRYFLVNIREFIRVSILKNKKQPPEVVCQKRCSVRKSVLWNFAKFTGNICARVSF